MLTLSPLLSASWVPDMYRQTSQANLDQYHHTNPLVGQDSLSVGPDLDLVRYQLRAMFRPLCVPGLAWIREVISVL